MKNVYDILEERGFIQQATHPEEIREVLGQGPTTFYIGFDATADSLTAGHFLTVMAMMHMAAGGASPHRTAGRWNHADRRSHGQKRHAQNADS